MATHYFALETRFFCSGQLAACVFNYKIQDPTTTDDFLLASQLVAAIDDGGAASWVLKLMQCMSNQALLSTVRARQFQPTQGNTAVAVFQATDYPGAIASGINTQQIAACINWIPTTTGPAMGRNFLPGVPENALESSRWEDAYIDIIQAFIDQHLTGFSVAAGIFLPIVWDRENEIASSIDDGYLSPKVGTQRRRERAL